MSCGDSCLYVHVCVYIYIYTCVCVAQAILCLICRGVASPGGTPLHIRECQDPNAGSPHLASSRIESTTLEHDKNSRLAPIMRDLRFMVGCSLLIFRVIHISLLGPLRSSYPLTLIARTNSKWSKTDHEQRLSGFAEKHKWQCKFQDAEETKWLLEGSMTLTRTTVIEPIVRTSTRNWWLKSTWTRLTQTNMQYWKLWAWFHSLRRFVDLFQVGKELE